MQALAGKVRTRRGLNQTLPDVCKATKTSARECLSESLGYKMLLSRSSALRTEQIRRKKCEMVVAIRKLLRNVQGRRNI